MKLAFEIIALVLLLLVMAAAGLFGMLMNFLALWLIACVAWMAFARIIAYARKRLYVGIWKSSEYPASRSYLLQAILRSCFWITVGLAVFLSLVPIQFPAIAWQLVLFQLWGAVAILCLLEWIPSRRISWPTNVAFSLVFVFLACQFAKMYLPYSSNNSVVITAPFEGAWYTVQGGNSCLINHHYYAGSQRFALDLILPQDGPLPLHGETDLESYRTFGQPLFSPVDGLVVDVVNDRRDQLIGAMDPAHAAGNYVTIKTDSGMFVLLAHLQEGSVLVKENDQVSVGQPLAKCGNSGNSSQPHLHMQAMTAPELFSVESRPLTLKFELSDQDSLGGPYQRNDIIHGVTSSP